MDNIDYRQICEEISAHDLYAETKSNIQVVSGGLKNKCYKYESKQKIFFAKKYNPDTKYARHLEKTRCESEFAMCNYLTTMGCATPKSIYSDLSLQINLFEYINGQNLFNATIDHKLISTIIDELAIIHAVPVIECINGCCFYKITRQDIIRYLCEAFMFLGSTYHSEINIDGLRNVFGKIADIICGQQQTLGNTQMHNGNIMVEDNHNVRFVDFEKAPPHFPQMDLISFINAREYKLLDDLEIVEMYLEHFPNVDKSYFLEVYDLLFIIDNLRAIKKIKKNEQQYKVVWTEKDGKREKVYEFSDSSMGAKWNAERKESINRRIWNIYNKKYSSNEYAEYLRKITISLVGVNAGW